MAKWQKAVDGSIAVVRRTQRTSLLRADNEMRLLRRGPMTVQVGLVVVFALNVRRSDWAVGLQSPAQIERTSDD